MQTLIVSVFTFKVKNSCGRFYNLLIQIKTLMGFLAHKDIIYHVSLGFSRLRNVSDNYDKCQNLKQCHQLLLPRVRLISG